MSDPNGYANFIDGSRFASGQGGTLTSMTVYVRSVLAPNNQLQMAIYTDANGRPGTLVANTAGGALTANSWNTLPITATLTANTNYWLVYNTNGDSNGVAYNNGVGLSTFSGTVAYGTWPTSFSATTGVWTFSIYATYGAPPPPTPTPSPAPSPGGAASHIAGSWLYGANMPWLSWATDFGGSCCGPRVSNNVSVLDSKLAAAHNAGMHVIRWWVFEGGSPQILRDFAGVPTGLNPALYTDIDAALAEAAKFQISYDFVLFGSTNDDAVTHQWWENSTDRAALVNVLTPLFAHYAANARIQTWEIVNEPEWQSRNGITSQAGMLATVDALANAVHANSPALVTVGNAQLQDMATWVGHPLDYYSPHYYDNFGTGSNDPFNNSASSPDGKPLVIGEFQASSALTPSAQQRWQALFSTGYAGGWAWSLSPEDTSDNIPIDLGAAAAFASGKPDLGPTP